VLYAEVSPAAWVAAPNLGLLRDSSELAHFFVHTERSRIFCEKPAPLFPCLIHKLEIPLQNLVEHFIGIQVAGIVESHFVLQTVGILVTDDMGNALQMLLLILMIQHIDELLSVIRFV
jgi:hypothetical protein